MVLEVEQPSPNEVLVAIHVFDGSCWSDIPTIFSLCMSNMILSCIFPIAIEGYV
jgi:hypothetical protein